MNSSELTNSVAIIGLSCRFPGAENADQFWENIKNGVESISELTDEELIKSGVPGAELNKPNYVKKVPVLGEIEFFDASFFGYTPREAKIMDPQHRLFLECCWKALEDSGYNPDIFNGLIGVFAGAGNSDYLVLNLAANRDKLPPLEGLDVVLGNDRDYLCTRVAYNLNLRGPALSVQTACSTSLVAVHLACDSILSGQCDMALAGASSINLPMKKGYKYIEEGISSPDGHTYAFDKRGRGTIFGSGVGVVVLKRLKEAIEDKDNIYAVIKGTAINNDGSAKVGFVAPGVEGQSKVIAEALAVAEVNPETISYVETHGTGTALGDPIEITALTKAYRLSTDKCGYCLIGSVKTNIGHTVAAAGIAGLIKTVLAMKNKLIPPSLNFEHPNLQINFDETPFRVNTKLIEWKPKNNLPIRAGVSSFGMGGTNAHVILEEAPVLERQNFTRPFHLLMLSAKNKTSLDSACEKLAEYLGNNHSQNLTDISYTLQTGRKNFNYRRFCVVKSVIEGGEILRSKDQKYLIESSLPANYIEPVIAFLFSGQGSQHLNMCAGLYKSETYFNEIINSCAKILERHIGINILDIIFSENIDSEESKNRITQTEFAQPALFIIEYALSKYLTNIGIIPQFMVGHSIGEYVAACISEVMSLEDALKIVALRGKLMQRILPGAMLSVQMIEDELVKLLPHNLDIAAINAPGMTVVSGSFDAIEQFEEILKKAKIEFRRLQTSHAFHSSMMDPILQDFKKIFEGISLKRPSIPYLSNTTGDWITDDQATNPEYYVEHLRRTVRFSDNITKLLSTDKIICLEVGPGNALTSLAKKHSASNENNMFLPCTRHPQTDQDDFEFLLQTLGKLWLNGITINWEKFYGSVKPAKISLPTYQFDKQKHFVDYPPVGVSSVQTFYNLGRREFSDWFYTPGWYRKPFQSPDSIDISDENWLIFVDEIGLGQGLIEKVIGKISNIIKVHTHNEFEIKGEDEYCLNLSRAEHYHQLFKELKSKNKIPDRIIYLRGVTSINSTNDKIQQLAQVQEDLFFGLLFLAQAIGEQNISKNIKIFNITNNLHSIIGGDSLHPEKAITIGPCRVIPKEYNNITCCNIDIDLKRNNNIAEKKLIDRLFAEISDYDLEPFVALRGDYRWLQNFELTKLHNRKENNRFRKNGVYLITGGLGGLGLAIAENLAAEFQARIVLLNRSVFPEKNEWDNWKSLHNPDDEISKKIEKLKSVEQKGGEILILSADVAKPNDMKNAMNEIKKRFGKLNGIIHAAGTINDGIVQLKSRETVENVLNPKVKGTIVLDSLANEFDLDFIVMFSSLNAVLAPAGQIDYCAANNFLDTFAQSDVKKNDSFVVSIGWPGWKEVGLAAKISTDQNSRKGREELLIQKGISPEEGVEVFKTIMENDFNYVAVSTYDLNSDIEQYSRLKSIENIVNNEFQNADDEQTNINAPIEPMNQIEETIAVVWKEMIGIEKVKLNDNFFEIGGHSLLATQIISRLREDFQLDLSIKDIFTAPTVAEFAKKIEAKILDEIKTQAN